MIDLGGVNQLPVCGVTNVDEERDLSQSVDELREHAESYLRVRIDRGTNGIKSLSG
jgi:hypothetical protein